MTTDTKNRPCPKCRELGHDSKGDHLFLMKDGKTWSCSRNGVFHPFYIERGGVEVQLNRALDVPKKSPKVVSGDVSEEILKNNFDSPPNAQNFQKPENASDPTGGLVSVEARGISASTRGFYGVVTECSKDSGEPLKHFYPVTVEGTFYTHKVRVVEPKDFYALRKMKGVKQDLFGLPTLKGVPTSLVLCEGEEDAMATYEMLKSGTWNTPVLGIPGADGLQVVKNNIDFLKNVGNLYFCPHNDEAGKKLCSSLAALFPKIKIIKLPLKDANDMLIAGRQKEFKIAFDTAEKYRPSFLVRVSDVAAKACTVPQYGRSYPWPTLQRLTYGMRDGEGLYVGAGVKIGKSEFINQLITHRILSSDGDIPAVIKFEEQPAQTLKRIAGKLDKKIYHRPDIEFQMSDLEKTIGTLQNPDKLFMYQAFGSGEWESVKEYIRYVVSEGSKTIIIDPVTKLTNHLTSSDTETALRRISDELACLSQDLGFFYVVTCHLKAPISGPPHERGGKVESVQFRGSRAMMENCFYMLGIERNKSPELSEEERNTSQFVLLEDRNFGNTGKFPVIYTPLDGQYLEPAIVGGF